MLPFDHIKDIDTNLVCDFLDHAGQVIVLDLLWNPGRKEAQLSVVSIIGKEDLWTNANNLAVAQNDATVVLYCFVHYRPTQCLCVKQVLLPIPFITTINLHANIQNHILSHITFENCSKDFP